MHSTNADDIIEKGGKPDWKIDAPKEEQPTEDGSFDAESLCQRTMKKRIQRYFRWLTSSKRRDNTTESVYTPPGTIVRTLQKCPDGYPRLAAFLDSGENFALYRRFGFLQMRVLLNKQDELRELEHNLDRLDEIVSETNYRCMQSRENDDAMDGRRTKMLKEIEEKFKEYTQLLVMARDLANFNKPSGREYNSVKGYFDEQPPLCRVEARYILCKEDLVTLKTGRESAFLEGILIRFVRRISSRLNRVLFSSKDLEAKVDPESSGIRIYDRDRISFLVSTMTIVFIVFLLICPVWILWDGARKKTTSSTRVFGTLSGFTLVFAMTVAGLTRAKRHEVFATSAAYCAVLVVFMSNVDPIKEA